jgi:hypothetical protein
MRKMILSVLLAILLTAGHAYAAGNGGMGGGTGSGGMGSGGSGSMGSGSMGSGSQGSGGSWHAMQGSTMHESMAPMMQQMGEMMSEMAKQMTDMSKIMQRGQMRKAVVGFPHPSSSRRWAGMPKQMT